MRDRSERKKMIDKIERQASIDKRKKMRLEEEEEEEEE